MGRGVNTASASFLLLWLVEGAAILHVTRTTTLPSLSPLLYNKG